MKNQTQPKPETLSPEQESVMSDILDGRNVLITGSAGTGKSTLLRELKRRFRSKLEVTGSTGIAAVNVGGMTLHSWACLGLGTESAEQIAEKVFGWRRVQQRMCEVSMLALDEISMIHGDLLDTFERVLQLVRESSKPFGGVQIIGIGDFLQLPPVSPEKDMRFAFQSDAWTRGQFKVHLLTKVFRQQDEAFSRVLNQLRMGELSAEGVAMLRSRLGAVDPNPEVEPVTIYTHNRDVDSFNQARLDQLPGEEKLWKAHDTGMESHLKTLQKNCLAPAELRIKVGAQVMLLKNVDPQAGLANGSIGVVESFQKTSGLPFVRFSNREGLTPDRSSWTIESGGNVLAERQQLPLRLAYSCSAHKSQGMTLDKVAVHLERAFDYGQSYVALSRVRTLDGLFIMSSKVGAIKAHPAAVQFYADHCR